MQTAFALLALIGFAALPAAAWAQQDAADLERALAVPAATYEPIADTQAGPAVKPRKAVGERKDRHGHRPSRAGKHSTRVKMEKGGAVPHFSFEQRTAREFDPLSLTLTPDPKIEIPSGRADVKSDAYRRTEGQVAVAHDTLADGPVSSAGIENMEKGNNHTIVVPLFDILNKLSDQPPPSATPDQ
jgi:hypothetical protein